jgi:SRSO17 transposase
VSRIVRVYRHRWTGTETFHRDGKQQLGLGDCHLRDVQGQTRHMNLVMLAYSLSSSKIGRLVGYNASSCCTSLSV